ncbi:MAG TPA: response regulator, partial [Nitrospirae bacterium]|nr:response regulator [Nitrospirota bacterium]
MSDRKRILLIDDEKDFCFFMGRNLEQTGEFEVMTASQGREGINLAREKNPDLILLDINMPQMSGPEIAEILFHDQRTKHIPVIFLTAVVTREEVGIEAI